MPSRVISQHLEGTTAFAFLPAIPGRPASDCLTHGAVSRIAAGTRGLTLLARRNLARHFRGVTRPARLSRR